MPILHPSNGHHHSHHHSHHHTPTTGIGLPQGSQEFQAVIQELTNPIATVMPTILEEVSSSVVTRENMKLGDTREECLHDNLASAITSHQSRSLWLMAQRAGRQNRANIVSWDRILTAKHLICHPIHSEQIKEVINEEERHSLKCKLLHKKAFPAFH